MSTDQYTQQDPTTQHDQPDSDGQQISAPGRTSEMKDRPDHGEESYRGANRRAAASARTVESWSAVP